MYYAPPYRNCNVSAVTKSVRAGSLKLGQVFLLQGELYRTVSLKLVANDGQVMGRVAALKLSSSYVTYIYSKVRVRIFPKYKNMLNKRVRIETEATVLMEAVGCI